MGFFGATSVSNRELFEHFAPSPASDLYLPTGQLEGHLLRPFGGGGLCDLYVPTRHQLDGELLSHFTKKLGRIIATDFQEVKKLVFLANPNLINVDGKPFYLFTAEGICLPECLSWTSGFSDMAEGLAAVIIPLCGSLTKLVETTIHEAAHLEYHSISCDVPNMVSENAMRQYMTLLFS